MTAAAAALAQLSRSATPGASAALRHVDRRFAQLLQRLGADAEVALAGALAMRAVALGHSGVVIDRAQALLEELGAAADLPDAHAWAAALHASALVSGTPDAQTPLVFQHGLLALRRYARYEQQLADALRARTGAPTDAVDAAALARLFALRPGAPDRQALAAWAVQRQRLTLVTGGPGTGKTTTVARLLALLAAPAPALRIALAAPTGRAAARLGEAVADALARDVGAGRLDPVTAARIPRSAQTLHRLLGWRRDNTFRHGAALPLPFDVVVVDEASMVDLPLMARLVAAVAPDARLVLLGDPDQLPAVEAGDVLGGLCAAAGPGTDVPEDFIALCAQAGAPAVREQATPQQRAPGVAGIHATAPHAAETSTAGADNEITARAHAHAHAPPLAGHRIHLVHGYRQANAAGIAALARAVQAGDADAALALLRAGTPGLHGIDPAGAEPAALERRLEAEVLPLYRALAQAEDPLQALHLAARVRVLTALRHGPSGAAHHNAWFAQRLGGSDPWFRGRLLMVTANSYRHGLFNGDTGVCWPAPDGTPLAWFETEGRLRAWSPGQLPAHDTAFAMTVHKAQGSEFDNVWLLLPARDTRVLSRELVYTAITRAKRALHIAASPEVIKAALARQAGRWSGLGARLSEARA